VIAEPADFPELAAFVELMEKRPNSRKSLNSQKTHFLTCHLEG